MLRSGAGAVAALPVRLHHRNNPQTYGKARQSNVKIAPGTWPQLFRIIRDRGIVSPRVFVIFHSSKKEGNASLVAFSLSNSRLDR